MNELMYDHLNKQLIPTVRFQASPVDISIHPSIIHSSIQFPTKLIRIPAHFVPHRWGQRKYSKIHFVGIKKHHKIGKENQSWETKFPVQPQRTNLCVIKQRVGPGKAMTGNRKGGKKLMPMAGKGEAKAGIKPAAGEPALD
jgi:hypothetical protein